MGVCIDIVELEAAINCYRAAQPARDGVLSQPVSALANVYGWMIWAGLRQIDADVLAEHVRVAYQRFDWNDAGD